jgi:hypothetical protein
VPATPPATRAAQPARQLPADATALAQAHRLRQQQLAALATQQTAQLWAYLDTASAAGQASSWAAIGPAMLTLVQAALREASRGAQDYVSAVVRAWGADPDPAGTVAEATFAATASDGRPLDTLLGVPAFETRAFTDQGMQPAQAKAVGGRHLHRIVATQVADAARVATGVAQINDRAVRGWVRMLTPPSCSRCVVLAGRFYPSNAGFDRHPLCDCVHIPAAEDLPDVATDPRRYFDSLTETEQDQAFTRAGARAIRDGADIAQVVNARRGMSQAASGRLTTERVFGRDVYLTREGITKRGQAGRRLGKRNRGVRLMPEQIYLEAAGDRAEAIRLLRLHSYLL